MNIKELRLLRKQLVARFGMADNAPTTEVVRRLIDEERIFADYPQDIRQARRFLELHDYSLKFGGGVKSIPDGFTRKDVGL